MRCGVIQWCAVFDIQYISCRGVLHWVAWYLVCVIQILWIVLWDYLCYTVLCYLTVKCHDVLWRTVICVWYPLLCCSLLCCSRLSCASLHSDMSWFIIWNERWFVVICCWWYCGVFLCCSLQFFFLCCSLLCCSKSSCASLHSDMSQCIICSDIWFVVIFCLLYCVVFLCCTVLCYACSNNGNIYLVCGLFCVLCAVVHCCVSWYMSCYIVLCSVVLCCGVLYKLYLASSFFSVLYCVVMCWV